MSLITRCPACGTMFRIVPDQLRISEGWVRCGRCSDVFDARSHLQTLEDPSEPTETAAAMAQPPDARDTSGDGSRQIEMESAPVSPVEEAPPAMLASGDESPDLEAVSAAAVVASELDSVIEDDVSFVRQARREALWHRPLVRLALGIVALMLGCLLGLQAALHERDRLAVLEPRLKPWLERFCDVVGCTVAVPRQIESVVIDSSTFNRLRGGDLFRLAFTIRNTSGVEVATPAVELTLTDARDQALVRRVLRPAEVGAEASLAQRGEWNAVLNMAVDADGVDSRIAGYRLLAFYP